MSDSAEGADVLIEGAGKTYREGFLGRPKTVVSDVSFKVEPGTIHGLLGRNGAGKTTTLKMLLGLVRPSAGRFEIAGVSSTSRIGRSGVGFLPEQPYFSPQLTAAQALRLYGRLAGVPRERLSEEIRGLLAMVGLEGRDKVRLETFSRGMLQRLGVAQALLGSPRVVVLDEPASGLDPVGQRDMRNLMLELRARGTTVLLSSHQLSEIEVVCDQVTILDRGRVVAEGDIDDLLNTAGQMSVRIRGFGERLPDSIASHAHDVAISDGVAIFSVPNEGVRRVVDAVDEAGAILVSVSPKRESLEEYFGRLLEDDGQRGEGE